MTDVARKNSIRRYLWRLAEAGVLLVLVVILCVIFVLTLRYTLPFVLGAFFAVLLMPLVRGLESLGVPRLVAAVVVLVVALVAILLAAGFVIVSVTREAMLWSAELTRDFHLLQIWVANQITAGQLFYGQLPPEVAVQMQSAAVHVVGQVNHYFQYFVRSVIHAITRLPDTLFVVVISVLTTFSVLVNRERMYIHFLRALPPGWSHKVNVVFKDIMKAFLGTLRVQALLMLLSAVLGVAGMWVLHIDYFVILGLLFGLTGLIPVVGSYIMTLPWAMAAFVLGDTHLGIKILILQLVASLIRHMVEPKMLADNVGLDMLSTLFGLYAGMKVLGVLGLFIGPILVIGLKSLLRIRLFVDFLPLDAQSDVAKGVQNDSEPGPAGPSLSTDLGTDRHQPGPGGK
ncbi:sporulation integral membrane protein YtvI [Alicyclobacillaceae bacterium I2511]|nr:sporulation integral membrane protein YtvI [Alicyclobacillaceae bacterium I2511]